MPDLKNTRQNQDGAKKAAKAKPEAKKHGGAREGAGRKPGVVSQAKTTLAENARQHGPAIIETLYQIMIDKEEAASARISAANSLLDRGYGRPIATKEVTGKDGGAIEHAIKAKIVMVPPKEQAEVSTRQMPSDDGDFA